MGDHWPWETKKLNPQEPFNDYWKLLYLPFKRTILHPGRGLDLLGIKVLQ
jgi:hypothetical protein